jgi:hypothetical protein
MSAVTIQQMAVRVSDLMEERLKVKGNSLSQKIAQAKRTLPRKVWQAAKDLAQAEAQSHNPKLLLQIDETVVAKNYDVCVKFLNTMNRWDRRKGVVLSLTVNILLRLVAVVALVAGVLLWRGYL